MSIFSRIFGLQSKSVDKTESGSPEIIRLGEFEKELRKLLGKDVYLARSDYKPLCTEYKDLYEQFSTLKKSKILEYFCSQNHVDVQQIESFIETFKDLSKQESTEIITLHNRSFLEKHLVADKAYLDNVLKMVDPAINLDDEQRRVVLSEEDYMLVIAGAGAGKTTTVAAKVKYLVEKKRTSKWLAEQLGVNPSTVSKWCTNTSQPDLACLLKIADLLEVDIRELFIREYKQYFLAKESK